MKLIDFSARKIPPHQITAAGYDGVVAYVSEARPGSNLGAKPVGRQYADALRAEGLHIVSNYQYGKPGSATPSDFTRGFAGGVADAQTALRLHDEAGGPDHAPIIFSIDEDIDLPTWNDIAVNWFRGINSVLGLDRTGIYGHSRVCAWAIQDEVIGRSTSPGRTWAWQTRAWSQGEREPTAVLFQAVIDTPSNPGPVVGGIHVDVNEVLAPDFGQWDLDRSPSGSAVPPRFDESDEIRSPYAGPRRADVLWFVLHTEDGDSGSARNLARYLSDNDREVSYHYTVDNDGHVYDVVDPALAANSVFEPGNSRSINLAFADSKANWSRQTWLDRMQRGIDIAAYIAVRDARRYGLRPEVISRAQVDRWETGITDHGAIVEATHVGDHTDVGPGFPWDYFTRKVGEYASGRAQPADIAVRTLSALPTTPLVEGATGPHVTSVQRRLNDVTHAGLLTDGEFGDITRRAVVKFQKSRGLTGSGDVGPTTWKELFRDESRSTAREVDSGADFHSFETSEKSAAADRGVLGTVREAAIPFGPAPYRMVTGPRITSSVRMELADLGIMRWDPDRRAIAAMFGDNFSFSWGQEWQSPSIVMYDANFNVLGIPAPGNRIAPNQGRRQLWPYGHNNPDYDTVLPCDFIKVGDWWYVAVMLSKGDLKVEFPPAQFVTEFWRSRDLLNWQWTGPYLDHRVPGHPGNTMLTFDQIDDYVYIFGTGGLARNKPVWMWRNKASEFPHGYWEPWGWDGVRWEWGIPNERTPILEGEYGELCFRYIDGNCVLSYLEGGQMTAKTVSVPRDDWRDGANDVHYVTHWEIENLYGGFISPFSHLNETGGMKFFVSQWIDNSNYRVYLVEGTLFARGPLRRTFDAEVRDLPTLDEKRMLIAEDDDGFPLPRGHYWGPLDGSGESWSNLAGPEPQYSADGLARWQEAMGIDASGVFDDATKEAAARLQYVMGWMPALRSGLRGVVREQEWDKVIRDGWRIPAPRRTLDRPADSPRGYEIGWYPGPGHTRGCQDRLRIYLHTTESQDWVTEAEDVAIGQANRGDVSFHYLVDDHHIINTVPIGDTAWAVHLDNPVSVQIAMVCTSGTTGCWQGANTPNVEATPKTEEQWLSHTRMLDMVAYTIAKVATECDIPLRWCDIDDVGANRRGVSSHYNYSHGSAALRGAQDTSHWDVPPTFPADVVLAAAKKYASGMERHSAAPAKAVQKVAKKAAPRKAARKAAKKAAPRKVVRKAPVKRQRKQEEK